MCVTSEAVRRCLVLSCSRRRGQALVGPNESSLSTGALASRASPCTHGRLSRLLGRLAHAPRGHGTGRCVRVAQELRAGVLAAAERAVATGAGETGGDGGGDEGAGSDDGADPVPMDGVVCPGCSTRLKTPVTAPLGPGDYYLINDTDAHCKICDERVEALDEA